MILARMSSPLASDLRSFLNRSHKRDDKRRDGHREGERRFVSDREWQDWDGYRERGERQDRDGYEPYPEDRDFRGENMSRKDSRGQIYLRSRSPRASSDHREWLDEPSDKGYRSGDRISHKDSDERRHRSDPDRTDRAPSELRRRDDERQDKLSARSAQDGPRIEDLNDDPRVDRRGIKHVRTKVINRLLMAVLVRCDLDLD